MATRRRRVDEAKRKRRPNRAGTYFFRERCNAFYCRWSADGRRVERRAGSEANAQRILARVMDGIEDDGLDLMAAIRRACGEPEPRVDKPTYGHLIDRYLDSLGTKRSPQNLRHERWRAGIIKEDKLGGLDPQDVTRAQVAQWTERLARAGKSAKTINRYLSLGSRAWRYAEKYGHTAAENNPFRQVEREPEPPLDKDPLTPDEAAAAVAKADADFRALMVAALATGARRGELLSLTWSCVDVDEAYIVIAQEHDKAGRGRRIPMTDELREALLRLRDEAPVRFHPTAPVFLTCRGRPHSAHSVRRRIDKLRERLTDKEVPHRKRTHLKFKDFRDAAVCNLLALGVPTATVARIVGHHTLKATERYLGRLADAQRDAIQAYSAVRFGGSTGGPTRSGTMDA